MIRRFGIALVVLAIGAAAAAALVSYQFQRTLSAALEVPDEGISITVPPGTPFSGVAAQLSRLGLLQTDPAWLGWYARFTGAAAQIQAGEYRVLPGETAGAFLEKLVDGEVYLHSFTIVEGWTFEELLDALRAEPAIAASLTSEDLGRVLETLGVEYEHPEGLFLPETYRFPRGSTDLDLLRQAHELLRATLNEEWESRAPGTLLDSPYDALILASIIEKETALASERPRIAGVFVRRLERGMRLQTDPTVIYGLGKEFDGNLTRKHLQTDTPYNTYTRSGLPPTPIALPGADAIRAALNPADGEEVYFVATGLGDGSHKFSATKDEHDAAVQEYLARLRSKGQ